MLRKINFQGRTSQLSNCILRSPRAKVAPFFLSVFVIALFATCPSPALAQNVQYTNNAVDLGQRGNFTVNSATQALEIQIPLGSYPGRAGNSVPVVLSYSSKIMRIDFAGYNPGHFSSRGVPLGDSYTMVVARYAEHSAAGWTSSLAFPATDSASSGQTYDNSGNPCTPSVNCGNGALTWHVDRIQIRMGDGSTHELRTSDQPINSSGNGGGGDGTYYSVDGSRMRYNPTTQTLFMSDGSRYLLAAGQQQHIDRNGNVLYAASGSTDTLGRSIPDPGLSWTPWTAGTQGPTSTGDYTYSLPGVGGANISYTFKWRNLGDAGVLTTAQALQYTADSGCPMGNGSFSPHLFMSDSASRTCITNANNVFNPIVLNQIVLPTGQAYTFTYNIYGEIDKVVLPTGGYERYVYQQVSPLSNMSIPYLQSNRGVVSRFVSASGSGTDEVQWQYGAGTSGHSVTAPDGTLTQALYYGASGALWGFSPDGARAGRTCDEQVYSAPDGAGNRQMLRRKLTEWTMTGSNATNPGIPANRNARVTKEVDILLDTGGNALAKTTTYLYDTTYEFSTGANMTSTSEYDYVLVDQTTAQTGAIGSFPLGILLRTTEKDYLDGNSAYRNLNILGLVTAVRVKDAAGNIVAQSAISYDEAAYPLISLGTVTSWTDPGTTVRGNATSAGDWLNTSNSYLTKHVQYDKCGSARNTWDANGNQTQTDYTDGFSDSVARNTYAYATKVTSPVPDPTGMYGSTTSLVTSMVYDFSTGRVINATDANNQTTTLAYADPINRLTSVTRPTGGGSTTYVYTDTPGSLSLQAQTTQDASTTLYDFTYFDGQGRPTRKSHGEGGNSWINKDIQYDSMSRVSQSSNPYRQGVDTPVWTTMTYDALGRTTKVTTSDGAHTDTAYSGNVVTATDQAGKQRSSVTDALGRLSQVTEAPNVASCQVDGSGCQTSYTYNVLGDLTGVQQGGQSRTYAYNSLKRLTSASNPESGLIGYQYDNNGNLTVKTDARSITTTYSYDALNRVMTKVYSDSTPAVSYYYDDAVLPSGAPSYSRGYATGRLVATTYGGGSNGNYYGYDNLGRVILKTQQTDNLNYAVSASYNLAGALTSETYPSGRTVNYSFDNAARLAGVISNGATLLSSLSYTASGSLTSETYGNNLVHSISYNVRLQPSEIMLGTAAHPAATLDLNYSYGVGYGPNADLSHDNGNVLGITSNVASQTIPQAFTYDSLNRLSAAMETNGGSAVWQQSFSYDRYGNRAILTGSNPDLTFDSHNRIVGQVYDAVGNVLADGRHTYAYDAENHLISVDNGAETYVYDGEGRRVKKTPQDNLRMVYDSGGGLIAEYDAGNNSLKKEYIYGVGGLLATIDSANGTQYLTSDHLGTPRVITSGSGMVVSWHDYQPFGEAIGANVGVRAQIPQYGGVDGERQKFTSKERDTETGLDYFLARYYSSAQGRFTSPDEFWKDSNVSNPQSWNKYAYARNNPLKFVDPTGEDVDVAIDINEKEKTGTIKITGQIALWTDNGSGLTHEDLTKAATNFQDQIKQGWNGTFVKDGITYTVTTDVTVQAFDNKQDAMSSGARNVIEVNNGPVSSKADSWTSTKGGIDIGKWSNSSTFIAHEFGHLMGTGDRTSGSELMNQSNFSPVQKSINNDYQWTFGGAIDSQRLASRRYERMPDAEPYKNAQTRLGDPNSSSSNVRMRFPQPPQHFWQLGDSWK